MTSFLDHLTEAAQPEKRWYVIHTYSGYENKVKANLETRVRSMHMEDKVFDVVIPMEDVVVGSPNDLLRVLVGAAGLTVGFAPIPLGASMAALFGDPGTDRLALIVQEIRLPRLLVGMIVGASLGMAGAALQG